MFAYLVDARRKPVEIPVACSRCGFPRIELHVEATGKPYKTYARATCRPTTEEHALSVGWAETEHGLICPICVGKVQFEEARDAQEGSESHVGMEAMAEGLIQRHILEKTGEGAGICTRCKQSWTFDENFVTDPPYNPLCPGEPK